jgi:SAM-dependent methyltransferase
MYDTEPVETLRYHHEMLIDKVRVESYLQAILSVVRKGDVVLDLGCGTGILSLFACMAGAKRVYAVDAEPIIEIAKSIVDDNGYQDRVVLMNDWSTYVDLPEKVDVILTETIGNIGFEEGLLGWVWDARKRFLKVGGRIIPQKVEMYMAPVNYDPERDRTRAWGADTYGLDFCSVKDIADNQVFPIRLDAKDVLGDPSPFVVVDLRDELLARYEATQVLEIKEEGQLHGLGGWFRASLTEDITLTSAPPNKVPSWWQVFFPLGDLIPVKRGDQIKVNIGLDRDGGSWSWKVKLGTKSGGMKAEDGWDFEHQTSSGEILPSRAETDFMLRPELDLESQLDLYILQSMDGERTIGQIALEVMERFPGTFRNLETAREHVYSFYEDYGRPSHV